MKTVTKHNSNRELIARAVIIANESILVNESVNTKSGQKYFALPGGHVDPGESCVQALERELREELEVEIECGDLCFVAESIYEGRKRSEQLRHELVLFFKATLQSELRYFDDRIVSPEPKKRFQWLPLTDVPATEIFPHSLKLWLATDSLIDRASGGPRLYSFHDSTIR